MFQSTLLYGERPCARLLFLRGGKFQSTLPYGERHDDDLDVDPDEDVSIHAPVRGATGGQG